MECAICYEKFFKPNSQEEYKKIYEENVINKNDDEIMKFINLLITPKNNTTYSCPTPNCECIICNDCFAKITHEIMGVNDDDVLPIRYDYFVCPYCRQIDWKYYMNTVLNELQKKFLSTEEFMKAYYKKCC